MIIIEERYREKYRVTSEEIFSSKQTLNDSLRIVNKFLQYAIEEDSKYCEAMAYNLYGLVNAKNQNWKDSYKHFYKVTEYEGYLPNEDLASTYSSIGNLYHRFYDLSKMIDAYKKSFDYIDENSSKEIRVKLIVNLATGYAAVNNYKESEKLLYDALALIDGEEVYDSQVSKIYKNLGLIHFEAKNFDEALKYYEMSLEYRKLSEDLHKFMTLEDIGSVYRCMGNFQLALNFYFDALEFYLKDNLTNRLLNIYCFIMECYAKLDMLNKAKFYIKKVEVEYEKNITPDTLRMLLFWKRKYYSYIGEYKKAFNVSEEYIELNKRLFQDDLDVKVSKMKVLYDIEKHERNSKLIQDKNEELSKKNYELKKTIVQLKEAQHDIIDLERKNAALATVVAANHELNQPLMVFYGNFELFLSTFDHEIFSDKQNRYIKSINSSFKKISNIVKNYGEAKDVDFTLYSKNTPLANFKL